MFSLAQIIGPVDQFSALVLVAIFVTTCVVLTTMILNRRSRQDISNEHELALIKQKGEQDIRQYQAETTRSIEFKKIDQGLITSHRES